MYELCLDFWAGCLVFLTRLFPTQMMDDYGRVDFESVREQMLWLADDCDGDLLASCVNSLQISHPSC